MKERKIPTKNYVIYGIIVVVTLFAIFYLNEWYKAYKKAELQNSYISKYVTEVNYNEFENYIQENPNTIIYIGKTNSESSIKIEKDLYKILKDNELVEKTIFLNLTDQENLLSQIQNKYYNDTLNSDLNNIPAIAIFSDGKIVDIVISSEEGKINKGEILKLLEGQEYIE